MTRDELLAAAQRHLALYPTTRANLRRVLLRKIGKAGPLDGSAREEAAKLVDEVIETVSRLGWIDDEAFTESKVKGLVRRGVSKRAIEARLTQKGVSSDLIRSKLEEYGQDGEEPRDAEHTAACAFVRRHKLGPYRADDETRAALRQKDLARMARAGFSFDQARKALDASAEEIDQLLRSL